MGLGYAELTFCECVSEPVLCFLADKAEPGAWNLPLFRIFADPFTTAGLVIDPKMHAGFRFAVHDLVEGTRAFFDCPEDLHDLALYVGSPSRYVIKEVTSRELAEPAAATSTRRLAPVAGRDVRGDEPVMIVRCQSGLPAVGEVLEPFAFPQAVAGSMRGSHHAPLLPVTWRDAHPSRFDGLPRVVCLGYQIRAGRFVGPRDMFDDPVFDRARSQAAAVFDYFRRHGSSAPHRLRLGEMEYASMPAVSARLAGDHGWVSGVVAGTFGPGP